MSSRAVLLGSLGFLSFAAVYNNIVVSPVLVEIARDLGVTVGTAGRHGVARRSRDRRRTDPRGVDLPFTSTVEQACARSRCV